MNTPDNVLYSTRAVASPPHQQLVFTATPSTGWLELWVRRTLPPVDRAEVTPHPARDGW